MLRHFASQYLRSLHSIQRKNEQVPKKMPILTVYTRWLDYLVASKNASFGQDKNLCLIRVQNTFFLLVKSILVRLSHPYKVSQWYVLGIFISIQLMQLERTPWKGRSSAALWETSQVPLRHHPDNMGNWNAQFQQISLEVKLNRCSAFWIAWIFMLICTRQGNLNFGQFT